MSSLVRRDAFTAGIAFFFSLVMFAAGSGLPLGTALRMGPGYVPRLLAIALLAVAVLIAARGLLAWRRRHPHPEPALAVTWKGVVSIGAGVVAFAFLIQPLGLIGSAAVAVVLTSLAQATDSRHERFLLAGFLAAFATLVFPLALELPLPILPHLN